jgi:hypothetical protein
VAVIGEVFAATGDELDRIDLSVGPRGPGPARRSWLRRGRVQPTAPPVEVPSVTVVSVDPVKLGTLEASITGADYEQVAEDGRLSEVTSAVGDEGPWLMPVRGELRDALAGLSEAEVAAVAQRWAATEEWEGDPMADDLADVVGELAELARDAQASGRGLWLWVTL